MKAYQVLNRCGNPATREVEVNIGYVFDMAIYKTHNEARSYIKYLEDLTGEKGFTINTIQIYGAIEDMKLY